LLLRQKENDNPTTRYRKDYRYDAMNYS